MLPSFAWTFASSLKSRVVVILEDGRSEDLNENECMGSKNKEG